MVLAEFVSYLTLWVPDVTQIRLTSISVRRGKPLASAPILRATAAETGQSALFAYCDGEYCLTFWPFNPSRRELKARTVSVVAALVGSVAALPVAVLLVLSDAPLIVAGVAAMFAFGAVSAAAVVILALISYARPMATARRGPAS